MPNGSVAPGYVLPYASLLLFWVVSSSVPMNMFTASNGTIVDGSAAFAGIAVSAPAERARVITPVASARIRRGREPDFGGRAAMEVPS